MERNSIVRTAIRRDLQPVPRVGRLLMAGDLIEEAIDHTANPARQHWNL